MNFLHLSKATHLGGYRLYLEFTDGACGQVDLAQELTGPVFEPLRDIDYFQHFTLNRSTIEWPNGADFAPEYLHSLLSNNASRHLVTA